MARDMADRVVPKIFAAWGMVSMLEKFFLTGIPLPLHMQGYWARKWVIDGHLMLIVVGVALSWTGRLSWVIRG